MLTVFIALLRAINVGKRQVPMAALRELGSSLGFKDVQSYIQSGNLVFGAAGGAAAVEKALEAALAERFGFAVDVVARTAAAWAPYLAANPFAEESEREPNRVMMMLSKATLKGDAAETLAARAVAGEKFKFAGGALWAHFPAGLGTSLLTPDQINKAAGSPTTARNWRTVQKLAEMAGAAPS